MIAFVPYFSIAWSQMMKKNSIAWSQMMKKNSKKGVMTPSSSLAHCAQAQPSHLSATLRQKRQPFQRVIHARHVLECSDTKLEKFVFEAITQRDDIWRYLKDLCDFLQTFFSHYTKRRITETPGIKIESSKSLMRAREI